MLDLIHPYPLDPKAQDLLERIHRVKRTPSWLLPATQVREQYERTAGILDIQAQTVQDTADIEIPVTGGVIGARVYWGEGSMQRIHCPSIVFSHGGGFSIGSIHTYDAVCRRLANGIHGVVVSLDYRLAPEHKFPTAANDVFDACVWWLDHSRQYGVDPAYTFLMGDSAGGTLSTQACLRLRELNIALAGQVLVYPGTGAWQDTLSHQIYAKGYLLDQEMIQWMFNNYLASDEHRGDWRFAPLLAPDLSGLPDTFIQLASCDPLVDEGIAYARQLKLSQVATEIKIYHGMIHGFYNMGAALPQALEAHQDTIDWVCQQYNRLSGEG